MPNPYAAPRSVHHDGSLLPHCHRGHTFSPQRGPDPWLAGASSQPPGSRPGRVSAGPEGTELQNRVAGRRSRSRKGDALPRGRRAARGGANLVLRSGRRNAAAVREEKREGRCVTPIDRRTTFPSRTLGRLPAGNTCSHQPRSRARPRGCAASAPPPSCTRYVTVARSSPQIPVNVVRQQTRHFDAWGSQIASCLSLLPVHLIDAVVASDEFVVAPAY